MPQTQRDTSKELPEVAWRGPFGGIQSEQPLDAIEGLGYSDVVNLIFRKSAIAVRPGYTSLPLMPDPQERILCVADFFNKLGNRIQVIITPTRLIQWDQVGQDWVVITGALTGIGSQIFNFTTVNYNLCFSQGADPIQLWDGIAGFFGPPSGAVPARFVSQVGFHLLVGYTIEGGVSLPQRVRWTGSDDPTDWTSYDSGFTDLLNDLGPITGICNVYQTGFIFQQRGIVQVIPTGIGTQPFDFIPISNKDKGNIAPYSLAYYGDQMACYVGKDNIYVFDGTQSYSIGDSPMGDGSNRRLGARSRIFAELKLADLSQVYGFITSSIAGNDFNAYWLVIPGGSVWIYYFDEQCWTRFVFDKQPSVLGDFAKAGVPEIMQLIGTIAQQSWSPATLTDTNPLDSLLIGMVDGTPGNVDFTNYSELPWSITSGNIRCGDSRHNKYARRGRIIQTDLGSVTYNFSLTNEKGQNITRSVSNGSGSGMSLEWLVDESICGMFLTMQLSGSQLNTPVSFSELALLYDSAEEFRNT